MVNFSKLRVEEKKMKKWLLMALPVMLSMAMAGCGSSSETSGSGNNAAASEPIKVTVGDFLGETFLYPVKIANEKGFFEEEFAEDNI